jgi:nitroreductase
MSQSLSAKEVILSRHSVRKYDSNAKISEQDLQEILELAASAPSSWNLQHWRFLVIRDQESKQRLLPLAYNQEQVVEASVVVIVLGDLQANELAPKVFEQAPPEVRDAMIAQINGAYKYEQVARDEAIRNGSLAAMQLMLAAKAKGFDTVAMGGYNAAGVIEAFNIPSRYIPVVMIPIGVAASPGRATNRFPISEVIINESF